MRLPILRWSLRSVLTLFIVHCSLFVAQAQQQAQYSQYMFNTYLYNPAAAGIEDYFEVKGSYRQLYQGVPGSNNTFYLTAHKAINQKSLNKEDLGALPMRGASTIRFKTDVPRKIRHGVGGTLTYDRVGLYTRTVPTLGYAIHLPVGKRIYWAFGANVGANLLRFDMDNVENVRDAGDAAFGQRAATPELGLGTFVYTDVWYVGLSTGQLTQSKLKFSDATNTAYNKLNTHYYLTGAYRIALDDEFDIIPSALFKYAKPTMALDAGVKVRYRQNFWAGAQVRVADARSKFTTDGFIGLVGFNVGRILDIGYSYDFTTSNLNAGSNGSHEILLGLRLMNAKNAAPKIW